MTVNASSHTTGVLDVGWSPDDTRLITGSRDYKIKIWNSSNGEVLATWSDHNCVRSVEYHPTQDLVATSGVDLTLKVRDSETGTELRVIKDGMMQGAMVMSSRWSPDGTMLVSGLGKSHTVIMYRFGSEQVVDTTDENEIGGITATVMIVLGIAGLAILFYPAIRQIRKGRR